MGEVGDARIIYIVLIGHLLTCDIQAQSSQSQQGLLWPGGLKMGMSHCSSYEIISSWKFPALA